MDKLLHALQITKWSWITCILKWGMKLIIHSITSTAAPSTLRKWYGIHPCGYLSLLGLKLIHINKRGPRCLNTLRPRQDGRHFADDIFKCIFFNENVWIPIKISLKFVPKGPINNIPAMVQIMAWRRPCDKPLSEPMGVSIPTHKCVARPQWIKLHSASMYRRPSTRFSRGCPFSFIIGI